MVPSTAFTFCLLFFLLDPRRAGAAANLVNFQILPALAGGDRITQLPVNQRSPLATRLLYKFPVQLRDDSNSRILSFSTTFTAWLTAPSRENRGYVLSHLEGLAFVAVPENSYVGAPEGYLGLLDAASNGNSSAHTFGVEIDLVQSEQFSDPPYPHIGIDVNNMTSVATAELDLEPGTVAQVWIEYNSPTQQLQIRVADYRQTRPAEAALIHTMNLSAVLNDYMYVGFSSSFNGKCENQTAAFSCLTWVRDWSFQTFASDVDATALLLGVKESLKAPTSLSANGRTIVSVISVLASAALLAMAFTLYFRWDTRRRWRFDVDANLETGPHKFSFQELSIATKKFSRSQALGRGAFGSVYKGFLPGNRQEVAVKRVSPCSKQGEKEFLSEVQIIGRLRHRNLVRLQGWCQERGEFLIVYDYMPGGSLDRLLFREKEQCSFSWETRMKAITGIATAVVYLHDECEQRIVHRDIKASNVLLDAKLNARLGDFGLARSYHHSLLNPESTAVAGTLGYLAPELCQSGRATTKTDVYSYGAFMLEVACGRRPTDTNTTGEQTFLLVDWVWSLFASAKLLEAADAKLCGDFDSEEMSTVLCLGLLCSHPDPDHRPTMRQVLMVLNGDVDLPNVPKLKPKATFTDFQANIGMLNGVEADYSTRSSDVLLQQ